MALRRLDTGRIPHGFMALLKLATMNIFTAATAMQGPVLNKESMSHWHASTGKMSKPHQLASQTRGLVAPVESAICQVGHITALAHQVHNSAMPLNQVNAASRWYCHTQGIVVKPWIIIPQGVKAPCYCKRLIATHTDTTSAPTRAVCYDASTPATMLTVHHYETIPNTKCTMECQHKIGTYARPSPQHINSMFQHEEWPSIIKLS